MLLVIASWCFLKINIPDNIPNNDVNNTAPPHSRQVIPAPKTDPEKNLENLFLNPLRQLGLCTQDVLEPNSKLECLAKGGGV